MIDSTAWPVISIRNVFKKFSSKEEASGLVDLSFDIHAGKITALIGESGAGKSTLLRLIYGLSAPDSGSIQYKEERVLGPSETLIPGHPEMRMVSQHFDDLNQYANVWDNVASRLSNTDLDEKYQKTEQVLTDLKIIQVKGQRIADLSGGEKQRVAIARALVTQPQVLLMDEPFNQVDAHFRDSLQEDMRQIVSQTGLTLLFVSHDPAEVIGLADYLVVLQKGKVMQAGDPLDVYENPKSVYVAQLLARSNVCGQEVCRLLGIESDSDRVAIHPEWIEPRSNPSGLFSVKKVIYRGFYKELIIAHGAIELRVYSMDATAWLPGMHLNIQVHKWKSLRED